MVLPLTPPPFWPPSSFSPWFSWQWSFLPPWSWRRTRSFSPRPFWGRLFSRRTSLLRTRRSPLGGGLRLFLEAAPLVLRQEIGAPLVDAERPFEPPAGQLEHGLAADGAVVLHRHVPGHEIAALGLHLAVQVLAAVVGVLLVGLFAHTGALHQTAPALGAPAGHLHHQRLGEGALRPAGAGQKPPEPAHLHHHFPAAQVAHLVGLLVGHLDALPVQLGLRLFQLRVETGVELAQHLLPLGLPRLHLVQAALHLGGEVGVHDVREFLLHQSRDHLAQGGGAQVFALLHHVLPIGDGGDGGGVGGRTAHPLLLQGLDQGGLGEPGRGLGEVLAGGQAVELQGLPLLQVGQGRLGRLLVLVPALLVNSRKAVELHRGMAGPKAVARRFRFDGDAVVHRPRHLAGQKTAPDQLVQPVLVGGEALFQVLRSQGHVGGPDGLMGVLGGALGLEPAGLFRIVLLAVAALDESPGRRQRLL